MENPRRRAVQPGGAQPLPSDRGQRAARGRGRPPRQRVDSLGRQSPGRHVAALDAHGDLAVSSATPVGGPDTYRHRDTGTYPWGQGPVLQALSAAARSTATLGAGPNHEGDDP